MKPNEQNSKTPLPPMWQEFMDSWGRADFQIDWAASLASSSKPRLIMANAQFRFWVVVRPVANLTDDERKATWREATKKYRPTAKRMAIFVMRLGRAELLEICIEAGAFNDISWQVEFGTTPDCESHDLQLTVGGQLQASPGVVPDLLPPLPRFGKN